ncbi:MAG: nucleoside triphosphate pyrophosphohydrolase [Eubacterium sp.]|jgi:tetrapyrrole methylase family protein/MazG family protein|nr:nucleoside triphosphate pyrophosphohydrolase [Eubacterium sp.]
MFKEKESGNIELLLEIMKKLRSKNGCPWDIEQTHESIEPNLLEETYEVMEAIQNKNISLLKEELGDLLLQIVFHCQIEDEQGNFNFSDVAEGISNKLIYRHPHVFGGVRADTPEKVIKNWEELKSKSKGETTASEGLERIPKILPALIRGQKVGKKAKNSGFDFKNTEQVLTLLKKEIKELEIAILNKNDDEIEKTFGDILFACCNLGRFLKKDSEKALTSAINKFIMRFRVVEQTVISGGKSFDELTQAELDLIWKKTK